LELGGFQALTDQRASWLESPAFMPLEELLAGLDQVVVEDSVKDLLLQGRQDVLNRVLPPNGRSEILVCHRDRALCLAVREAKQWRYKKVFGP